MSKFLASLALGLACLLPAMTLGADAPSAAADPELEKRVMAISEELRCLVCQNQTIADSHAELAVDLKNQVREMLQKGQTESQIKEYMVQRYGDFVLYRPAVKSNTWMLWLGPFVLLVGALIFLLAKLKKRNSRLASEQGLSATAQRRADQLLGINGGDSGKTDGPSAVPPSVKEEA
jgi:cytochrome c-type biogenesis protein CcmH